MRCVDSESIEAAKFLNTAYASFHFYSCRYIRGMHDDFRRLKTCGDNLFFNPEDNVVTCPVGIVAQIVIEAQMGDSPCLQ